MRLYSIGDRVTQSRYGDGTVTEVNAYHTRIDFDEHGPRTFSSAQVTLTPSTSLAPVKAAATRRKRVTKAAAAAAAAAATAPTTA